MKSNFKYLFAFFAACLMLASCGEKDHLAHLRNPNNGELYNGKYCARVTVIGTIPGMYRVFNLNVNVFDNHLTRINWNNVSIDNEVKGRGAKLSIYGKCKFKAENGAKITVQIMTESCTITDVVNEEEYLLYSFGDEFWTTCEEGCGDAMCESCDGECESCDTCDSCDDACEEPCEDDPCDSY